MHTKYLQTKYIHTIKRGEKQLSGTGLEEKLLHGIGYRNRRNAHLKDKLEYDISM
jgi:hypothetical protein